MNHPSSSETLETNAYGRTQTRQIEFLTCLAKRKAPDTGDLYNRTNKANPSINGFNAWTNVATSPLYATYKQSEQALFTNNQLQAICTNDVLKNLKKASYIVDLGCGDSKTTIYLLQQLIDDNLITTKNLQNKTIIIFDDSGTALEQAEQNRQEFFKQNNIKPTLKAQKGNRNNLKPGEKLLDEYPGDKFIFSTGFTIGNLDETSKNKFCAFDPRYTHTLLATYFVKPDKNLIPFVEATYGKKVIEENPEKNNLPEEIKKIRNTENLTAMHTACIAQFTHILRASGRSEQDVDNITFTSKYDEKTGRIEAGFEPNKKLSISVGEKIFFLKKNLFYPLLTSTRFDTNQPPVAKKHISRNNNDLVGCSVHELTTNHRGRNIMLGTAMALLVLLLFVGDKIIERQRLQKIRDKVIIEKFEKHIPLEHYYKSMKPSEQKAMFDGWVNNIGNILNTVYDTEAFTDTDSNLHHDLIDYCLNHLDLFLEIGNNGYQNYDMYQRERNKMEAERALQYIAQAPYLLANQEKNKVFENQQFISALENTASLSSQDAQTFNTAYPLYLIKPMGLFPINGRSSNAFSSVQMFGIVFIDGKHYVASMESYLYSSNSKEKKEHALGNQEMGFRIDPFVAKDALDILKQVSTEQVSQ